MSKKRYIDTKFWSDGYIEELDPIEKLLFLYLLTNERTTVAGIYELPRKIMAVETGIENSMLDMILKRFEDDGKIITYKKWIRLVNSDTHQNMNNKKIQIGVKNVIESLTTEVRDNLSIGHTCPSNNIDLDLDLDLDLDSNDKEPAVAGEVIEKPVEKAYYDAVRELDVPIRNHNNLRSKVTEIKRELGEEGAVQYLNFLKDKWALIPDDGFKPKLNEALELYAKRGQIRSWIAKQEEEYQDMEIIE